MGTPAKVYKVPLLIDGYNILGVYASDYVKLVMLF